MNINILGISELKWIGMGEFNSDDHYIYYCGQEFFRRNGVAIMVNKRVRNAVLGCNLKNDRMISVRFQGKPFQYSHLENPMNSMKRQKERTLKDELPRSAGAQYATGNQWRNNSRKNEGMEPKQKQAEDVTGDRSKVRCYKEQYCIGTWNVRSMNQGKLEVVKREMARVNINILGISEQKWTRIGEFNSEDHYINYWGQESLR